MAPAEIEARVQRKAGQLGRELKLPGFRKGKVPAPLVLQRLGREAVLEEAVRDGLGSWYAEAIRESGIVPVGDPKIDLGELPAQGKALEFSFEIGVLPPAELGEYAGLEVGRREAVLDEELVEREIEAMRERLARLETVEHPAGEGDYVVVDYVGRLPERGPGDGRDMAMVAFSGGEGRDQLVELGGGKLIPGFEEGLLGAGAGETRTVQLKFPADYRNSELAGREASFEIAVKEVKGKQLPEVDEDFAVDAGFDDVQELREDIGRRILEAEEQRVAEEFREAALDAAVSRRARIRHRGARALACPGDVGADAAYALPPRDHARGLSADRRAWRGGDSRGDGARRRAGAAPRGGAERGRRGRGDRALRAGSAAGRRADGRARGDRARAGAHAAARGRTGCRSCARISRRARRSS